MSLSRTFDLDAAGALIRYFDARDAREAARLLDVLQESSHCLETAIAPEAHVLTALRCAPTVAVSPGPSPVKGRRVRRRAAMRRRTDED